MLDLMQPKRVASAGNGVVCPIAFRQGMIRVRRFSYATPEFS